MQRHAHDRANPDDAPELVGHEVVEHAIDRGDVREDAADRVMPEVRPAPQGTCGAWPEPNSPPAAMSGYGSGERLGGLAEGLRRGRCAPT